MSQLIRALVVFRMSQMKWLVAHADTLIRTSYSFLGQTITNGVLRATFFGHFCAGESETTIKPTVDYLQSNGIGSILDYAAESDIADEEEAATHPHATAAQARIYDYKDGAQSKSSTEIRSSSGQQLLLNSSCAGVLDFPSFC